LQSFNSATSLYDADQIPEGIDVDAVFGETGGYLARLMVADGVHGYTPYGNVSYFGATNVTIDDTIFCTWPSNEGNMTKFNSLGGLIV
jgi:hypothetical protein